MLVHEALLECFSIYKIMQLEERFLLFYAKMMLKANTNSLWWKRKRIWKVLVCRESTHSCRASEGRKSRRQMNANLGSPGKWQLCVHFQ